MTTAAETIKPKITPRWVGAYFALWLVLSLGAELPSTAELTAVFAGTIALSAVMYWWDPLSEEMRKL